MMSNMPGPWFYQKAEFPRSLCNRACKRVKHTIRHLLLRLTTTECWAVILVNINLALALRTFTLIPCIYALKKYFDHASSTSERKKFLLMLGLKQSSWQVQLDNVEEAMNDFSTTSFCTVVANGYTKWTHHNLQETESVWFCS